QGGEGRNDLQVGVASEKRSSDEVVAGTERGFAQGEVVEESEWRERNAHARQGAGVGWFRNTEERTTEAEGVGEDSAEDDASEGGRRRLCHAGRKRVVAFEQYDTSDAENGNGWQHSDTMRARNGHMTEEIGNRKDARE